MAADEIVGQAAAVEHAIESDAIEERADLGGLTAFLCGGQASESRNELLNVGLDAAQAQRGMQLGEPFRSLWMADGVELEFDGKQHAAAVAEHGTKMGGQNIDALFVGSGCAELFTHMLFFAAEDFLEEREENIFLIAEIGVESAARLARHGGNVLEASHLKPIPGKDALRRVHESPAR